MFFKDERVTPTNTTGTKLVLGAIALGAIGLMRKGSFKSGFRQGFREGVKHNFFVVNTVDENKKK